MAFLRKTFGTAVDQVNVDFSIANEPGTFSQADGAKQLPAQ
jgi:hypothetical protein